MYLVSTAMDDVSHHHHQKDVHDVGGHHSDPMGHVQGLDGADDMNDPRKRKRVEELSYGRLLFVLITWKMWK
jgi:hypothetical protein